MAQQQQPIPSPSSGWGRGGRQYTGSTFGDTTFTKVFVGDLSWGTKTEAVRRYFEQFGDILDAVVITDKTTGHCRGYGFVTFLDPESARRACADPSPIIDGKRARCNLASQGKLGRVLPFVVPFGSPASAALGGLIAARGAYIVSPQALMNSPYGYGAYRPGTVGTTRYPYNQLRQAVPGYAMPGHQMVQFGRPGINATSSPTMPWPYRLAIPRQPQFFLPAYSPETTSSCDSDDSSE